MIKYLEGIEKIESRKLYEEVFNDSVEFTDYYYGEHANKNKILGCFEDSKLISMMHFKLNNLRIKKNQTDLCYIFGVATKNEYRRKGYMEGMLKKALLDIRNEGYPLCYLIPENPNTYNKFDFTTVRQGSQRLAKTAKMEYDVDDFLLTVANENHFEKLSGFAIEKIEKESDFFRTRDFEYYRDMVKKLESENGNIELLFYRNNLIGYAYVSCEDQIIISEIMCEKEFEEVLINLISCKYGSDNVMIKTPPLMIRILNPEVMAKYISAQKKEVLRIRINDSIIESNSKTFKWEISSLGSSMMKTNEEAEYEMNISDFTAWIFSYKEFPELPKLNLIKGVFINEIL